MESGRPPIMHAPSRDRVEATPGIPHSLSTHARHNVIQHARELVKRHPEHPDFAKLEEAVRQLDVLEGKREA